MKTINRKKKWFTFEKLKEEKCINLILFMDPESKNQSEYEYTKKYIGDNLFKKRFT